jgi:hypothetical protein
MTNKLDYYTWTKQMIAKSTHPKKLKKLFIKRYGTRNVPLLIFLKISSCRKGVV